MFTGHFGLDEGPFHGKAEGDDVYVSPELSEAIARLSKALAGADSVITVTGPVGVGKTTLVRRALAELDGKKIIIPVDRLRLAPDEILELLLARFDFNRQPQGTIQRVAAFRRLLQEQLAAETRIFIVVEDAERIGVDALLELEALTSTDSGESCDAGIVLMGSPELLTRIASPALARLRQRVRLRQTVVPFTAAEVDGYMRHCISLAGGEFDSIFEPGTAQMVYRYSAGVARVVDTLCESALEAAADAELATILPELVQLVAENCGLEPQFTDEPGMAEHTLPDIVETDLSDDCPTMEAAALPPEEQSTPMAVVEKVLSGSIPAADDAMPVAFEHVQVASEPTEYVQEEHAQEEHAQEEHVQEELVQEERGQEEEAPAKDAPLALLPQAASTEPPAELLIDAAADDSANIPTLSSSMRIEIKPETDTWVRPIGLDRFPEVNLPQPVVKDEVSLELAQTPTISPETDEPASNETGFESPAAAGEEVKAQIQAAAATEMAVDLPLALEAEFGDAAFELKIEQISENSAVDRFATDDSFMAANDEGLEEPELDALEAAIHAANAWQSGDNQLEDGAEANQAAGTADGELEITLDKVLEDKNTHENAPLRDLDQWAVELSKAQSLEDISDMLAETLFGNQELQQVSDQILANRPAADSASAPEPTKVAAPVKPAPVRTPVASTLRTPPSTANGAAQPGRFDMTLSQRIDMVNTLKKGQSSRPAPASNVTEIVLSVMPDAPQKPHGGPEPIEAQIDTAITQSRLALSSADLARLAAEEKPSSASSGDKSSRGLFGLFKRSSKN